MNKKLRLGILVDSFEIQAWAFRSLQKMMEADVVESVLLIVNADLSGNGAGGMHFERKSPFIYDLYNKVDEKIFVPSHSAVEKKSLTGLFADPDVLAVRLVRNGDSSEVDPKDVEKIKAYDLDILLKFGFDGLCGEISHASRYGVWFYVHGDDRQMRSQPAGYWEVVKNIPETGAALEILSGNHTNHRSLYRSWYFTFPFSPARNRNAVYWEASSILPRLVRDLYQRGPKAFFDEIEKYDPKPGSPAPNSYDVPSNFSTFRHIPHIGSKILEEMNRRLFYLPTWYLLFNLDKGLDVPISDFTPLMPPKDRFWADPHVIPCGEKYYVFVEELIYKNKKGHISVIEIDSKGNYQAPVPVLEADYHLSYPFVFQWQDKYYMVPETAKKRTIDLYECVEFPYRWKFCHSLMENVRAVDTTLFYEHGLWWLFTAITESERTIMPSELFLFYSPDLLTSRWTAHPRNPVISDIKKARPAGQLFRQDGKIYRPSQYSSGIYGYGFDLNEVTVLSETAYAEKEVFSVRPSWDQKALATHTFSKAGNLTIIDAFTRRSKIQW